VLVTQTALSLALLLDSFVNEAIKDKAPIALGVVLFAVLTLLYVRGWGAATRVTVIAVTLLIGFAIPLPFTAPSLAIMVGPVLAMLITSPRWVVASAVLTLALLIARAGGGAYAEVVTLVLYTMSVVGLVATQLILQAEIRTVREQVRRTETLLAEAKARRAEAEASEARFAAYFRASPVPSLIARRSNDTLLDVNKAFIELIGSPREELIDHNLLQLESLVDPEEAVSLLQALHEPQAKAELRIRRKDGEVRTVLSFAQPTVIAGEACVVVACFDLTDQRRVAALEQRQQVIEEASRAKSAFLANMSHELRTPLNAILGFSKLLEERVGASLEERQRSWLRNIQTAGAHLLDLINDVLDISKVEAGRYEIRPEQISLADLVAPAIATARQDAEARGLAFAASEVPMTGVFVDPLRTRQVLLNLLSNAVKFTERGGRVRLAIGIAGNDLELVVSDTGIGIAAADQHRVFGSFERLHEGRYEASGTGLGLALTKRIVELQGGSISFISEVGVGTTFTVSLPGAVHTEMAGPRILIVEDDPGDAALIAALVAEIHLPVEIVGRGGAALATARRDAPTGVVLDLRLPDMRGEAVLEALQADGATRSIPVIVVTVEDDEGRTRPLGAADHLTKPIDAVRLRRWLSQVAGGERGDG